MQDVRPDVVDVANDGDIIHGLLEQCMTRGDLPVPLLPEVAVRVVSMGSQRSTNAQQLSGIINADPALTICVLRIAASAAKRPSTPIVSLQHAVAWLGFDEVANIAFTVALQGKMLDVPGQQHKARQLWRHSLASALWSRHLARVLGEEAGLSYLCGLVHNIGKVVTLGAVHDVARRSGKTLGSADYDRLIEIFHRHIGGRVVTVWQLPAPVLAVTTQWETYAAMGTARFECKVVNVAHHLADYTLQGQTPSSRDALMAHPAYRDLGLGAAGGAALFDAAPDIVAELDCYLAP